MKEYFKVEMSNIENGKGNENNTEVCIIADHFPTIPEVLDFYSEGMIILGYKYVVDITKISNEEAHRIFDLNQEEIMPILRKDEMYGENTN